MYVFQVDAQKSYSLLTNIHGGALPRAVVGRSDEHRSQHPSEDSDTQTRLYELYGADLPGESENLNYVFSHVGHI